MIPVVDEITFGAKVIGFFKKIPTWLYIALAVAALIGTGVWLHSRAVKSAYNAAYAAGVLANEQSHIAAQARAEARAQQINSTIRTTSDEEARHISSSADDQRLRGPGKATCPVAAASPGAAGGHVPSAGTGPAEVAGLPDSGGPQLIALPFADTVSVIEQCALNRNEAAAWRLSDDQQRAAATPSPAGATK